MAAAPRHIFRALTPLVVFLVCVLAQAGCTCSPDRSPIPQGPIACRTHTQKSLTASRTAREIKTIPVGTIPGTFSITSTGEASYVMPLVTVPGRAGVEPALALTYDSSGGDGVLGV